jgi:endonuclease YncB( thermonuclease family)
LRTIIALSWALAAPWPASAATDDFACRTKAIGSATVRAVVDGRTLMLADDRELRLGGIEVGAGEGARAALQGLVGTGEIAMAELGPRSDRYGRVVALATPAGAAEPLQITLLAQGLARVSGRVGDAGCAVAFRDAEEAARDLGFGLWSDPPYLPQRADRPDEILAREGRFSLVEGIVLSVHENRGTIYVNFGRRWSRDFTATVAKRNERRFAAACMQLKNLTGQRVRVRGTVEQRGGPLIELASPEQIELATPQ